MFADEATELDALIARVSHLVAAGRPVLIGTGTVTQSAQLGRKLETARIRHQVLNADQSAAEAAVVAAAGLAGVVTVATNMAGRGTDIGLGEGVAQVGGLHVLSFQLNDCARQDRQLAGRCARQGNPGSVERWLALPLMKSARMPLTQLIAGMLALGHTKVAGRLARVSLYLHQWMQAGRARRMRARLLANARYWDARLAVRHEEVER